MFTFDLSVGNLSNRKFQLFAVAPFAPSDSRGNDFYSCWKQTTQPDSPWTPWQRWIGAFQNGGPPSGALTGVAHSCAVQLFDDRLMVLAIDPTGAVFATVKLTANPDAGWMPWTQWSGFPPYQALAGARLVGPDFTQIEAFAKNVGVGRAQIFAITPQGQIQTFWQVSNNPNQFFSQFFMPPQDFSIPGVLVNQITAASLWSGQVQVWAVDQNGFLWSRWKDYNPNNPEDPDTAWVDWARFRTSDPQPQLPFPVLQIASAQLSDGRVQLFALSRTPEVSGESQIWSSWQESPAVYSGWTSWSQFQRITYTDANGQRANVPLTQLVAGLSAANRTQLWAVTQSSPNTPYAGTVWTCWDNGADTGWTPWQFMDPAL